MQCQLAQATGAPSVDALILPDIGPVAAVLTKPEAVDVGGHTVLEGEDQLVAGAVKGAQPAIVLYPHDQVFELGIDLLSGLKDFCHMPPIHADEMDRTSHTVTGEVVERRFEEVGELRPIHLA